MRPRCLLLAIAIASIGCDAEPATDAETVSTPQTGKADGTRRSPYTVCESPWIYQVGPSQRSPIPANLVPYGQNDWFRAEIWGAWFWILPVGSPQWPAHGWARWDLVDPLPYDQYGDQPGSEPMDPEPKRYAVFARVPRRGGTANTRYHLEYPGVNASIDVDAARDRYDCGVAGFGCGGDVGLWVDLGDHVLGEGTTITATQLDNASELWAGSIAFVDCN